MKRYYYTDPLAAAWMAKHFGMVFDRWTEGLGKWTGRLSGSDTLQDFEDCTQLFIHPDSLHLLEPRAGDLVQWLIHDGQGGYIPGAGVYGYFCGKGKVERIVERDGKQLFWPEVE